MVTVGVVGMIVAGVGFGRPFMRMVQVGVVGGVGGVVGVVDGRGLG